MALQSVKTESAETTVKRGSTHGLWIGEEYVLTVSIDKHSKEFSAEAGHIIALNSMIQDLARATKAVIFHAENDTRSDQTFAMGPIAGITDAIILLSQLAEAVQHELSRPDSANDRSR